MSEDLKNVVSEVPQQIFDKFISELRGEGVSESIIKRLQKTLSDGVFSDVAVSRAILLDDSNS